MAAPTRQSIVQLGPRDGSTWTPPFGGVPVGISDEQPLLVVPPITKNTVSGKGIQDRLPADNVIYNLSQLFLTVITHHAALEATQVVTLRVRRAGSIVGGGPFAGWADGAAPDLPALVPVNIPFVTTNTAVLRPIDTNTPISATQALVALQPGDVVTIEGNIPTDFVSFVSVDGH